MMELIKITETKGVSVVSARDLHFMLGLKTRFNDWITNYIRDFDFIENKDFTVFTKNLEKGGKTKEYTITLDRAIQMTRRQKYGKNKQRILDMLIPFSEVEYLVEKERIEFIFGREIVENLFSEYIICSQYPVSGGEYRIDWYIPELNLAIEFDENHHLSSENKRLDKIRQNRIEVELGCKFLRYKQ